MSSIKIFPDTYKIFSNEELIKVYSAAPGRAREVLKNLSEDELRARPFENKWSIKEIICHLADSELMGAGRIRQTAVQGNGIAFASYNQDQWARDLNYQDYSETEFNNSLDLFESLRKTSSSIFRNASDETWKRTGVHYSYGELSLRNLLELYTDHFEKHISQILDRRKLLGKGIDFPLLIEKRLF